MIRVLQVVNKMQRAGLETMLMNYYRNIDRDQIQFDFLTHRPEKGDYDDEIISMGGKVYYAPRLYPQNYPKYFKWMKGFFYEHPEYNIIHSHIDAMSYVPLKAAKDYGIPNRIAHSHSTAIDKDYKYILKQYFRERINSVVTNRLACGAEAGQFLFKNHEFKIIPNAVDASIFCYNQCIRDKKRNELGYSNEFVIGHVGRISYPKNHKFLIKIFYELQKKYENARLLLVGVGEGEVDVRKQIKDLGIESKVKFLGNRDDVFELYQAMDVFVLPSLFEGVPVVGIEAQFADLPCIFSDRVPVEVKFNNNCNFIGLDKSAEYWADTILQTKENFSRTSIKDEIINSRYNIKYSHSILEDFYKDLLR
jgi:glycosyltransferase involved in cell wall biosynthesis